MKWVDEKENLIEYISLNMSYEEIGRKYGITGTAVKKAAIRLGINLPKRRKYMVVDDFFDNIDSEIKAYLLGYFIADGCICIENKKHNGIIDGHSIRMLLNVSEDDSSVIKLFKQYIIPQGTISKTNCQNGVKFNRKPQVKLR